MNIHPWTCHEVNLKGFYLLLYTIALRTLYLSFLMFSNLMKPFNKHGIFNREKPLTLLLTFNRKG